MEITEIANDWDDAVYGGWTPETAIAGKDVAESASVAARIATERSRCWQNARKAVLELEDYASASYMEGVIGLPGSGVLIEHGWVCRDESTVIDPTLPKDAAVYFPESESRGQKSIYAFLAKTQGVECAHSPFPFAFGFGGSRSPSYTAAWRTAWAWQEGMNPVAAKPAGSEAVGVLRRDVA